MSILLALLRLLCFLVCLAWLAGTSFTELLSAPRLLVCLQVFDSLRVTPGLLGDLRLRFIFLGGPILGLVLRFSRFAFLRLRATRAALL